MKQTVLTFSLLALTSLSATAQDVYLSCDFEEGIPADFSLYDQDGRQPSTDMSALGFVIGTPWIAGTVEDNTVAISTSWYKSPGTSDDWMVLPALTITSEKAVLNWRAMASDKDFRDGYKIFISEVGSQPSDFDRSTPFHSVVKEQNAWTSYSLSLASYVGKTIYIAFVNDSKDKTMLYVDDLFVGVPSCVGMTMNAAQRVLTSYGEVTLSGTVTATLDKTLHGFTVGYEVEGQHFEQHFDKTIYAGGNYSFELSAPLHIDRGQTLSYRAWVEAEGDKQVFTGMVSAFGHHVVAEEITGTWCGYCVRGILAMEQCNQTYPDHFIGLAVHNNDPMAIDDPIYLNPLMQDMGMNGFPNACLNRNQRYKGDPAELPNHAAAQLKVAPDYDIVLSATYDAESNQMNAHCDLYSSKNTSDADLRVAFVTVEDSVHGTNAEQYYQQNYSAGDKNAGRFGELPSVVSADLMWYMDVVRGLEGGHTGMAGMLPTQLSENGVYSLDHSFTFEALERIHRPEMTSLVVLLFNGKNNQILNADKLSLASVLIESSGIEAVTSDSQSLTWGYTLNGCRIANLESARGFIIDGNGRKCLTR